MNRAEKRRQQKQTKGAAKSAHPVRPASAPQMPHTQAISQALDVAVQHHSAGRLPEAEKIYRQILHSHPDQPVALHLLGVVAHQVGQHASAVELIGKAIEVMPDYVDAHYNLGNAFKELGRLEDSVASYQKAIAIKPDYAGAHCNMGVALQDLGRLDEAVASYQKAITLHPDYAQAHSNLDKALLNLLALSLDKSKTPSCRQITRDTLLSSPPKLLHRLQIEVSTWCNLKCAGCPRTIQNNAGSWNDVHMPKDVFQAIVNNMPPSNTICLQGVGEATLHPDFQDLVRFARDSGKYKNITFNTNSLTRSVDYYKKLKENGVNFISVSIDSLDQDIATKCREGTNVKKLKARTIALRELMADDMVITIVVSRLNLDDIRHTLEFLDALERPSHVAPLYIELQKIINFNAQDDSHQQPSLELDEMEMERFRADIVEYRDRFKNLNLSTNDFALPGSNRVRCPRPFFSPYVTVEGYLTPCCVIEDADVFGKLNMATHSLKDAWNEPIVKSWLESYVEKDPAICDGCCFQAR